MATHDSINRCFPGDGRLAGYSTSAANGKATVAVTERALDSLVILREAERPSPHQALGLVVGKDGVVSLVLDSPDELDWVFSRGETPILFITAEVVARFRGRVLDRVGLPGRERFTLDLPQPNTAPLT